MIFRSKGQADSPSPTSSLRKLGLQYSPSSNLEWQHGATRANSTLASAARSAASVAPPQRCLAIRSTRRPSPMAILCRRALASWQASTASNTTCSTLPPASPPTPFPPSASVASSLLASLTKLWQSRMSIVTNCMRGPRSSLRQLASKPLPAPISQVQSKGPSNLACLQRLSTCKPCCSKKPSQRPTTFGEFWIVLRTAEAASASASKSSMTGESNEVAATNLAITSFHGPTSFSTTPRLLGLLLQSSAAPRRWRASKPACNSSAPTAT
mmetsp:Transcript_24474/g.65066  ORF Transcript_24474/g.65066 Transcript_24474/m.65066 type:complete len:269 (-) Transcript_24474:3-809(-)